MKQTFAKINVMSCERKISLTRGIIHGSGLLSVWYRVEKKKIQQARVAQMYDSIIL